MTSDFLQLPLISFQSLTSEQIVKNIAKMTSDHAFFMSHKQIQTLNVGELYLNEIYKLFLPENENQQTKKAASFENLLPEQVACQESP